MANYKPEVKVADKWLGNQQVFESEHEALAAAFAIMDSWALVTDYRASVTYAPVNCAVSMTEEETAYR